MMVSHVTSHAAVSSACQPNLVRILFTLFSKLGLKAGPPLETNGQRFRINVNSSFCRNSAQALYSFRQGAQIDQRHFGQHCQFVQFRIGQLITVMRGGIPEEANMLRPVAERLGQVPFFGKATEPCPQHFNFSGVGKRTYILCGQVQSGAIANSRKQILLTQPGFFRLLKYICDFCGEKVGNIRRWFRWPLLQYSKIRGNILRMGSMGDVVVTQDVCRLPHSVKIDGHCSQCKRAITSIVPTYSAHRVVFCTFLSGCWCKYRTNLECRIRTAMWTLLPERELAHA